jgi:hypothetical protein
MVLASLTEAFTLIRRYPVLSVPGIVAGLCASADLLCEFYLGDFFAGKLLFFLSFVILFFTAGLLGVLHRNDYTVEAMMREGKAQYFRVLIPSLIILFGIILALVLVIVTAALAGFAAAIAPVVAIAFLIGIPAFFLTFFYDTAAVFEEKKAFEAIRRSIVLVGMHIAQAIGFFIIWLVLLLGILFTGMIVWTGILFDQLEPLTRMNATEIQSLTPSTFVSLLGSGGIWITAIIYFACIALSVTLLIVYKACFFRRITAPAPSIQQVTGEFDSKGRWFKY